MGMKGRFTKKLMAFAASAVMGVTSLAGSALTAKAADLQLDNYAKLLQYSLYFYDANYCGAGTGDKSHFSWRDDCHTGSNDMGGFHDAGDGIICGLTEGFTASTLGWLYYEYKEDFDKTGTTAHLKDITDEFARYMKNCTTLDGNGNVTNFIYEMGDDGKDHSKWRAPELMGERGNDEIYSTTDGASDVAAQYAAALAQNYINFKNEEDLTYAKALYDFAAKNRKMTYEQMTYSDKSVEDDIAWAAGWLYIATGEQPYLDANSKDTSGTNDWVNDYYYGGVWLGAAIINAEITGNWTAPVNYINGVVNANKDKYYVMNSWGSARHNTLMQTCAMIVTKHKDKSNADFSEWCQKQMNMILGDNNANVCLVVGYNDVSATSPHHRAASNLYVDDSWSQWGSWDGNYANVEGSHTLYGALCGGPTSEDFTTFRKLDAKDSTSNEVALDYQVGLVGAAAGLYSYFGTGNVVAEIGDGVAVYPEEIAIANGEVIVDPPETQVTCSFADKIKSTINGYIEFEENGKFSLDAIKYPEILEKFRQAGKGATVKVEFVYSYDEESIIELKNFVVTEYAPGNHAYGDANLDGDCSVSDAVAILQYLANSEKYGLSEQALVNADVDGVPGVTGKDAAVIQMVDAGIYTVDDLPLNKN
ncbi:MAG: glycoside hydrolase family 9 protein [Ruminococcus sp.]|nr:glycoside hydrolase family 9 protein [Ruminococcus sp.]